MTNKIQWNTPKVWDAAIASAALNSQTTGSIILSGNIANGTDLLILMDVSVILGSITPGTTPPGYLEIHVAALQDDATNYADVFSGGPTFVGAMVLKAGASIKYGELTGIQIPPGDFKVAVVSQAGVSLASSGNSVKTRRYNIDANA